MRSYSVEKSSPERRSKGRMVAAVVGAPIVMVGIAALTRSDRREPMEGRSFWRRNENTIEGRVTVKRPVDKVFEFYRNFKNLPSFLGDVMAIDEIGPATSRWTIKGPLAIQAQWTIRVTEERPNELIRYETESSPALKTYSEIYFAPGSSAVRLKFTR